MTVKAISLVTGEEIVGKVLDSEVTGFSSFYTVEKPAALVQNPEQPGNIMLIPYAQQMKGSIIQLEKTAVKMMGEPVRPLADAYLQFTTGLVKANEVPKLVMPE